MKHTIYSNVSESMKQIYEAHWETGNEIGSKNGQIIAFAQREALTQNKTHYDIEYVQGKRRIIKKSTSRDVGIIVNKQGVQLSTKLDNFIQWRTYSSTGTTVVGGMFRSGSTEIRENGKVIAKTKVDSVGKGSINILQKLNYGLDTSSSKVNVVNNAYSWNGKPSISKFRGTHTEGYGFAEKGRRSAMGKVNDNIRNGFSVALARREKGIKAQMKKAV